jgi:exonuclease III
MEDNEVSVVCAVTAYYPISTTNRNWNILSWNMRGINYQRKWNAINNKIEEIRCMVFCFQETKRDHFDHSFINNFIPKRYNNYAY